MALTRFKGALVVVLLVFTLVGCQTTGGPGPKTTAGAVGGAAVGGLMAAGLGGNAATIAGATILGGLVGGVVGDRLDAADQRQLYQTAQSSLEDTPTGTTSTWRNPDTGHHGTFTPTRTYETAGGQPCREYEQTIYIDGQPHKAHGTACRQPDGSWRIVNS
jgi:surface antigen